MPQSDIKESFVTVQNGRTFKVYDNGSTIVVFSIVRHQSGTMYEKRVETKGTIARKVIEQYRDELKLLRDLEDRR